MGIYGGSLKSRHTNGSPVNPASSDDVQVAVADGGRAESKRLFTGQTVQRTQNHVRHVIGDHPRADQNITERGLARPLGTVSHLREAVSVQRERRQRF